MNQEERLNTLFSKVYMPVFMSKLAEAGVELKSNEDVEGAIKIASIIKAASAEVAPEEAPVVAPQTSAIKAAAAQLEAEVVGDAGTVAAALNDKDVVAALSV
jgi:hypothetical protein